MSDEDHDAGERPAPSGFAPPGGSTPSPSPPSAPPPPPPPAEDPAPASGWWKASDGFWYPPQQDPTAGPPVGPPTARTPPAAGWAPPPMGQGPGHPGTTPDGSLYYAPGHTSKSSRGLSGWALGLGIASIVLFWTCGLGVLLGILAVIFGVMARNRARESGSGDAGRAQAGLITGLVGIVGGVLFLVWAATALIPDVLDEVEAELDDGVCEPDLEAFDPDC